MLNYNSINQQKPQAPKPAPLPVEVLESIDRRLASIEAQGSGPQGLQLPAPKIGVVAAQGAAATTLWSMREGRVIDWTLHNNSVNILYVLQYANQPVGEGWIVAAGGRANAENWTGDLIIAASAANSEIRYTYMVHGYPWEPIRGDA